MANIVYTYAVCVLLVTYIVAKKRFDLIL